MSFLPKKLNKYIHLIVRPFREERLEKPKMSIFVEITLVARDVTIPQKYPSRLSLVCKISNFHIHFDLTQSKMVRLA